MAGLPHLYRPRNVDPSVAVDEEALWQAAQVPVLIRRLDVCKARVAVADPVTAHRQLPREITEELAAHEICVPGAAGTIQKNLCKTLCAVLVRQPMDDDAGVLAVETPSRELHRHRDVAGAGNGVQADELILRCRMPCLCRCRDSVEPELHTAVSRPKGTSLLCPPDVRLKVGKQFPGDLQLQLHALRTAVRNLLRELKLAQRSQQEWLAVPPPVRPRPEKPRSGSAQGMDVQGSLRLQLPCLGRLHRANQTDPSTKEAGGGGEGEGP